MCNSLKWRALLRSHTGLPCRPLSSKQFCHSSGALGVEAIPEAGVLVGPNTIKRAGTDKTVTAKDIILAPGSIPFVPPGITIDGKTVFTSDDSLKLESVPDWVAIIGSGYIGLEFSDVYTALGSEVQNSQPTDSQSSARLISHK